MSLNSFPPPRDDGIRQGPDADSHPCARQPDTAAERHRLRIAPGKAARLLLIIRYRTITQIKKPDKYSCSTSNDFADAHVMWHMPQRKVML
jgi:hypothetical protein